MKLYFYIITFISGLLFFGCSNCNTIKNETNLEKQIQDINSAAKKKFNSKYSITNNQNGNYALVIDSSNQNKSPVINKESFFIYDLINNRIIFEDEVVNANVFWETDSLVTVTRIQGMIKKDSETKEGTKIYSYDVIRNKKSYR